MMLQPLVAAALLFGQATAAPPDCITRQEASDMTVAFLPHLVDAVSRRCRPHLQPTSFLAGRGDEWIAQLRREAAPRRESALRALAKMGGGGGMPAPPEGASAEATFEFMAGMATGAIMLAIQPQSCADIDILAESLRPLPPENVGRIVATTLSLAKVGQERGDDDDDDDDDDEDEDADEERDEDTEDREGPAERSGPTICPA